MAGMEEQVTVWAVPLGGIADEVKGTLSIEGPNLVFAHDKRIRNARIPLGAIVKVKRALGSPVLVVTWASNGEPARMAFYFSQPPPLEDPSGGRRRRHRKRSAQYLMQENAGKLPDIRAWRSRIQQAAQAARGRENA